VRPTPERLVRLAAVLGLAAGGLAVASRPATGQGEEAEIYLPMVMAQVAAPFATPRLALPPTDPPPRATDTPPGSTQAPEPSATGRPTNTREPTGTPTLQGAPIDHPTGSGTIILQLGWTQTDQPGQVWEEMNGTPWLTLYGDGHLVASDGLFNPRQELLELQVDEYTIQRWLRELTYVVGVFSLEKEYYEHVQGSKPVVHLYVDVTGGDKRLDLAGFREFERRGAGLPEDTQLIQFTRFVRLVEAQLKNELLPRGTPFVPDRYTILVQQLIPPQLVDAPRWDYALNIRAIAEAAPTAASNYEDHVVAHKFADKRLGEDIRDVVLPEWEKTWTFYAKAAEFAYANKRYAVGARQEVPGGSLFLPDAKRDAWYRRDALLRLGTSPRLADARLPLAGRHRRGASEVAAERTAGANRLGLVPLRHDDGPATRLRSPYSGAVRRGAAERQRGGVRSPA